MQHARNRFAALRVFLRAIASVIDLWLRCGCRDVAYDCVNGTVGDNSAVSRERCRSHRVDLARSAVVAPQCRFPTQNTFLGGANREIIRFLRDIVRKVRSSGGGSYQ